MSVDFGWRRFNFFDKNVIQDPENPDEKFLGLKVFMSLLQYIFGNKLDLLLQDVCVDCWCSGVGGEAAYLGESRGGVFRLGKNLDQYYWRAYQASLTALHAADKYIFSIGVSFSGLSINCLAWMISHKPLTILTSIHKLRDNTWSYIVYSFLLT